MHEVSEGRWHRHPGKLLSQRCASLLRHSIREVARSWLQREGSILRLLSLDSWTDCSEQCSTHASHNMEDTGASHRDADSRHSCQITICGRCVGSCLFISETDKADTEIQAFLSNVGDRKTWDTKDNLNAEVVQCSSNDLCSGAHRCRWYVVRG